MPSDRLVTLEEIRAAHDRIQARIMRTPLVALGDTGILLKAESLQPSGSFKLRGAINSLLSLPREAVARGVVAHSSGNHAIAVAMAAASLGVIATIVMPHNAPEVKLARTRALGARAEIVGPASDERAWRARELAEAEGLALIEPYDSFEVLAATGTIALEVLEDLPGSAASTPIIFVPVSGGGLAGGIATAAKLTRPDVRVIGVEPEVAADALASWRSGERVALEPEQMAMTMADGLRVCCVGERPWPHLDRYLDDIVTVSEDEIRSAMRRIAVDARLIAEPSGAVAAAAVLAAGEHALDSQNVVAILSGGNVDEALLADVLRNEVHQQ